MDLTPVIERVSRIPARYRRFTVPPERARRFYRVPDDVLEQLLDLGFPHRGDGDSRLFDRDDLKTVVLMLRLRSPKRAALEAMARSLVAGAAAAEVPRTVTIQTYCPRPGHAGECRFTVAPALSAAGFRRVDAQGYEGDVRLPGGERHLSLTPAERQLFDEVCRFEFHHIPYQLNQDLGFLWDSGLADCTLANHFMASRGREMGVDVRAVTGLFLTRPFANRHFWVELRRGAEWAQADPFYLTALVRWGVLDADAWPPHRSPLGAYWRLDLAPADQLVAHAGLAADPQRLGHGYFVVR